MSVVNRDGGISEPGLDFTSEWIENDLAVVLVRKNLL